MTGICIISLDCESKWGMADHIDSGHEEHFTSKNLLRVYSEILELLKSNEIRATFAFVGGMTLPEQYFKEFWQQRLEASAAHAAWLAKLFTDINTGSTAGWFLPELIEMVKAESGNEIASHGFSHISLHDTDESIHQIELEGIRDWIRFHGLQPKTFIFPRNLISSSFDLQSLCISGYRARTNWNTLRSGMGRLTNFLNEFYPFIQSQKLTTLEASGLTPIPGDFFLNWRSGIKKYIPLALTAYRFKHALKHAARNNGVVHLWFHPHNLINGRHQKELLSVCLKILRSAVKRKEIVNLTQAEYVQKSLK